MQITKNVITKSLNALGIEVKEMAGDWYYFNKGNLRYGAMRVNKNTIMFHMDVKPDCPVKQLFGEEIELKMEHNNHPHFKSYYNHIPDEIGVTQAVNFIRILDKNSSWVRELKYKKHK